MTLFIFVNIINHLVFYGICLNKIKNKKKEFKNNKFSYMNYNFIKIYLY